jgi:hypothetical protein
MACYFIAHHHGGRIEARRAEPHGAIFKLNCPCPTETRTLSRNCWRANPSGKSGWPRNRSRLRHAHVASW